MIGDSARPDLNEVAVPYSKVIRRGYLKPV